MKNFFDSIVRTPGVLLMSILMIGFAINAGVGYIHSSDSAGPSLLAAASLVVGQFILIVIHQLRKIGQGSSAAIKCSSTR